MIFNISVVFILLGCIGFCVLYLVDLPRMDSLYVYLPWLFCFVVLGSTASLSEHILILKQRSQQLFFYGFMSYSLYLFGLAITLYLFDSIQSIFVALAAWSILRFLYFLYLLFTYGEFSFDMDLTRKFILFGSPLVIHVLLGAGMEYVDGYLVNAYFERNEFSYFRYGARELPINTIFISALASAFIPLAVTNLNDSLARIKERLNRLMNILFPLSTVLMLGSPFIFTVVYSDEFLVSAHIFNIYLLIICSRILLPQIVLYAKHKNSVLMAVAFVEFVMNIGLSLWFMRDFGLYGIAFATVIAFMFQKILLIVYNKLVFRIPINDYIPVRKYLLYTIALYLIFGLSLYFYM